MSRTTDGVVSTSTPLWVEPCLPPIRTTWLKPGFRVLVTRHSLFRICNLLWSVYACLEGERKIKRKLFLILNAQNSTNEKFLRSIFIFLAKIIKTSFFKSGKIYIVSSVLRNCHRIPNSNQGNCRPWDNNAGRLRGYQWQQWYPWWLWWRWLLSHGRQLPWLLLGMRWQWW